MSRKRTFSFGGPGAMVTAAFIGPGTVTVCMLAGVNHGMQLLWAVVISILLTILFQEMASRLGIISRLDLTSLIKREISSPILKVLILIIVLSSIVIGNGAYEAGNISGGALGLDTFIPTSGNFRFTPMIIGMIAFAILWLGKPKFIERSLTLLVGLMSLSFLVAAVITRPDLSELFKGIFIPKIPENGMLLVLGVIGTTIVPYNLFLHASLARVKWNHPEDIGEAKRNTTYSVLIGGLISLSIVITASAVPGMTLGNATDLGKGLEPIFGPFATYLISIGLMAAGLTSAVTAPLAASYVMAGGFGWNADYRSWKFRLTWIIILGVGVFFSSIGFKPIDVIRFAQVANGLLLPAIGILLVWLCSKPNVLGPHKNKLITTIIGLLAIFIIAALGIKSILSVLF